MESMKDLVPSLGVWMTSRICFTPPNGTKAQMEDQDDRKGLVIHEVGGKKETIEETRESREGPCSYHR